MEDIFLQRRAYESKMPSVYWPAVLFACVFEPLGEEYKLLVVVFGLLVMVLHRKGDLELRLPNYSGLIVAVVLFGLFSGLVNGQVEEFGIYKFLRDVAYYISPFLLWIVGCGMGKAVANEERLWTTLFAMSVAAAFSTLVVGVASNGVGLTLDSFKANELTIYAIVLLLAAPKSWKWRSSHKKLACALGIFDAVVLLLTLSRTTIICLVFILVIISARSFPRFSRTVTMGLICFAGAAVLVSFMPSPTTTTFMDKVANSLTEVSSDNVIWTDTAITQNWRGYEKYCATTNFENADSFTKLFGNGFGYQLYMGGYAFLVVNDPSGGIPFLHNGYYSVLFKCGALGLGALILFYVLHLLRMFGMWFKNGRYIDGLSLGILVCLAFCSYVIEGLFIPSGMYYFTLPLEMAFGLSSAKDSNDKSNGLIKGR